MDKEKGIEDLLCDVRKSFRILLLFTERICSLIRYIGRKLGLKYKETWHPWGYKMKPIIDKWATHNWVPLYYRAFGYKPDESFCLNVILQCDTGYWDIATSEEHWNNLPESSFNVENYDSVTESKSRLIFGICKSAIDLAHLFDSNWASAKNSEMSDEFELPLSEKKSKHKAYFKVFDLADFKDNESTDKALKAFIDYANAKDKGFDIKWQEEEE